MQRFANAADQPGKACDRMLSGTDIMAMVSNIEEKILSLAELLEKVETARAAGRTIVHCHGCFDIVHPGHVRYLQFAREQGDVLIVTLAGDSGFPTAGQRPYISQDLRAENLAALMFVDFVHVVAEATAENILERIRPDLYVKGREYEHSTDAAFLAEKRVVEEYGGRIVFSSGEVVFSSSELLERLPSRDPGQLHRLCLVSRRYGITRDSLDAVIEQFKDLHVLIVGDIVLDRYVFCDALGVASEAPMMSLARRDERTYVGGAAIVARHVAAMGAHAFLLSSSGSDDASRLAQDVLAREGVDVHLLPARSRTVEKFRYLTEEHKLFKVDCGSVQPLDSVAEQRAALILEQQSKVADAVIFCDFGYGMVTAGLLGRTLPTLRHNIRTMTADVSGGRADLTQFRHVDLLCPTEREMRSTLNDYESGLSAVAWALLQQTQARHLFVTLEKRGVIVFERSSQDRKSPAWSGRLRSEMLPSFAEHAIDRLGCGDAMLAISTLALASGGDLMHAAYLGNAAAAIEISMIGNHPVDVGRLVEWTHAREELGRSNVADLAAAHSG